MADLVSPELKPREPTTSSMEAEEKKKLGNDAFVNKKYDEALKYYSEAITLDPNNAVFYSNRSACHASKGEWKESLEDAKACVNRDPKFIKGYYRMSVAQLELKLFDDAAATGKYSHSDINLMYIH
jgi:tetratricopeptide (TPR) repeat protein